MNVLHINQSDIGGGAAIAGYRLHQGLLAQGVDSRLVVGQAKTSSDRVASVPQPSKLERHLLARITQPLGFNYVHLLQPFSLRQHPFYVGADILNFHNLHTQQAEIQHSKVTLERLLGQPVTSFAYPYGTKADYTSETVEIARSAGFSCTCSNFSGLIVKGVDRFQLPRFLVRNWSGKEFAQRLQEWFDG